MTISSVSLCPKSPSSYKNMCPCIRATLLQCDLTLTNNTYRDPISKQGFETFIVTRDQDLNISFGRHNSTLNREWGVTTDGYIVFWGGGNAVELGMVAYFMSY